MRSRLEPKGIQFECLKGVFAKNERGYRLNAIKKRFWSLLILLLSVASIRRKLLKTTHTKEHTSIQIQKVATFNSDHKKKQFNFKQIIQILQPIIIDFFPTHLFIFHNIFLKFYWFFYDPSRILTIFSL